MTTSDPLQHRTDLLRHRTYQFIRTNILPVLDWTKFESTVEYWIERRENASVKSNYSDVLPTLSYTALGGDIEPSIPLTAAWMFYIFGARVLDDIQDQDAPNKPWTKEGLGQSIPIGVALLSITNTCLSHLNTDAAAFQEILAGFGRTGTLAAKHQSFPTNSYASAESLEQYFTHIIATTAELFAVGAWAGGRLHTTDENILQALRDFGFGLGMKTAIVLDCRDLKPASPDKPSDLTVGSYKLPVLYAVSTLTEHPDHRLLIKLLKEENLSGDRLETVVRVLEDMGAISWSVQVALEYEKKARLALDSLPDTAKKVLVDYVG
ncbi:MAG: polyprenyl synthetase family protein [Nitrososphaera sp.]|nr:polyprenyl synthetase family protein [Nitrososphaera sp.]